MSKARLIERVGAFLHRSGALEKLLTLSRMSRAADDHPHQIVVPYGTYSPWLSDPSFRACHAKIRRNTLVDIYRCYELWQLAGQAADIEGDALEVGVWRGGTGCLIAARLRDCAADAKVFLCDTFAGVVKAGEHDSKYGGGEHADTSRESVEALAREMGLSNVVIEQGIFPDETGRAIEDRTFRFAHIDVDTYLSARDSFAWVWPRLAPGGAVVFDDYGFYVCPGVTRLVNEVRTGPDRIFWHNLNGHGVIAKLK